MVAFNFQPRFAAAVEAGDKRQTIRRRRRDGRDPCKPGDALQLYAGMRTKACRKLRDAVCVSVLKFRIDHNPLTGASRIYAGRWLDGPHRAAMAAADGFADIDEMIAWFEATHSLPFAGWLIEWTVD